MASTAPAAPPAAGPDSRKRAERRFYSGYMIAIALFVFTAFAPSFYLRGIAPAFGAERELRPDMIVHAIVATAFVLCLPLQAGLIAGGRVQLHAKVGRIAVWIGAALVPLSYVASAITYRNFPTDAPVRPATISAFALFAAASFGLLLWWAWRRRADPQAHKRLIVTASLLLLGPAFSRFDIFPLPPLGLILGELTMLAMFAPLWVWDLVTRGRPHWATVAGTGVFLAQAIIRLSVMMTDPWAAFVAALPGFGWP